MVNCEISRLFSVTSNYSPHSSPSQELLVSGQECFRDVFGGEKESLSPEALDMLLFKGYCVLN